MKDFIILITFSLLFSLHSCQEESKSQNTSQIEATVVEEIIKDTEEIVEPETEIIEKAVKVEVSEEDPDIIEVKEAAPLPPAKETPIEEIKKIKDIQKQASPNKEKTCEDLLKEYKNTINKFLENQDLKYMETISDWTNDVIFNQCKNDSELKAEFDKWEGILNGDE